MLDFSTEPPVEEFEKKLLDRTCYTKHRIVYKINGLDNNLLTSNLDYDF